MKYIVFPEKNSIYSYYCFDTGGCSCHCANVCRQVNIPCSQVTCCLN